MTIACPGWGGDTGILHFLARWMKQICQLLKHYNFTSPHRGSFHVSSLVCSSEWFFVLERRSWINSLRTRTSMQTLGFYERKHLEKTEVLFNKDPFGFLLRGGAAAVSLFVLRSSMSVCSSAMPVCCHNRTLSSCSSDTKHISLPLSHHKLGHLFARQVQGEVLICSFDGKRVLLAEHSGTLLS